MKTSVRQLEFSRSLNIANRFVSTRAQLPILTNIAMKVDKTKLTIMATNLEISISSQIGAKTTEEGEIAIPARTITDLISNIKSETIALESEKEKLSIKTDELKSNLVGLNLSDFPPIPQQIPSNAVPVVYEDFVNSLTRVMFAVSRDETRSNLTGVLFNFDTSGLTLVSSDGFRLSFEKMKLTHSLDGKIIVPKNILLEMVKFGSSIVEKEIKFALDKENSQIIFSIGGSILSSRLIEGNFPDFDKIVPKSHTTLVNVDKSEFLDAVKLTAIIARDSANVVKLVIGDNKLTLQAESSRSGNQEVTVPAKVEGTNLEISYNYRFLEEPLSLLNSKEIEIEFTGSNAPGVIKMPGNKDFFHLIMPVKS